VTTDDRCKEATRCRPCSTIGAEIEKRPAGQGRSKMRRSEVMRAVVGDHGVDPSEHPVVDDLADHVELRQEIGPRRLALSGVLLQRRSETLGDPPRSHPAIANFDQQKARGSSQRMRATTSASDFLADRQRRRRRDSTRSTSSSSAGSAKTTRRVGTGWRLRNHHHQLGDPRARRHALAACISCSPAGRSAKTRRARRRWRPARRPAAPRRSARWPHAPPSRGDAAWPCR
jgi:hypothetical protein